MNCRRALPWPAALCLALAGRAAAAGTYEAPLDARKAAEAKFTTEPKASKAGDKVKITFAASAATDVEVAVLDAQGKVVRHLAAGLLGENAPAPLKKNSLSQELVWDLRDDSGKAAKGGPFKVRARLGSKPKLEKVVGRSGKTLLHPIAGLAVDAKGQVYVTTSEMSRGRTETVVLDREGKYLRTVVPYPANTPEERLKSVGRLEVADEKLPIVFNGHGHNILPLTSGMKRQVMAFSPKGHLVLCSAVGTICNHGPPRHLLALHPEGGAPEGVSFVGPLIRRPKGFMGGAGEGHSMTFFDAVAVSPDGGHVYWTSNAKERGKKERHHGVFRMKWSDADYGEPFLGKLEAGGDEAHFKDPCGLAVDAAGRLYVCDRGNSRVMVFDPAGKLLGKFAVEHPEQIAVHPATGEAYVVSRREGYVFKLVHRDKEPVTSRLLKFSPFGKGEVKELARLDFNVKKSAVELMALDAGAKPPKVWLALYTGWRRPSQLVPVAEKGGAFEIGANALDNQNLAQPMYLAADAERERVYVGDQGAIKVIDLKTGKVESFPKGGRLRNAVEPALDASGNVYVSVGWSLGLHRFDPTGKPLPFEALGSHKMLNIKGKYPGGGTEYICRASGVTIGARGHVVAANGDIYILKMNGNGHGGTLAQLDVYGPDGKLKKEALVARPVGGSSGLAVDPAGNVYIGSNLKPAEGSPMTHGFAGKVPEKPWVYWRRGKRELPWHYPYYNPYLFHWGAVFKFPPSGGEYFGAHDPRMLKKYPEVAVKAPEGTPKYRNGSRDKRDVWVRGALWRYGGVGPIPDGTQNWGDPSCACWNSRFAVDGYGRVFAPNVFRFSVEMLDTAGNHIVRIGRYGNADSSGPESKVPKPEIPFGWPAFNAAGGGKLYVSDPLNRRVSVIGFEHAAEARCAVR